MDDFPFFERSMPYAMLKPKKRGPQKRERQRFDPKNPQVFDKRNQFPTPAIMAKRRAYKQRVHFPKPVPRPKANKFPTKEHSARTKSTVPRNLTLPPPFQPPQRKFSPHEIPTRSRYHIS